MIALTLNPTLFQLGPFALTWHGLFSAAGIAAGIALGLWVARRDSFPEDPVLSVAPWAILGGMLGARILHVADNWDIYSQAPAKIFLLNEGGIGLLGAIVGGSLAGLIAARIMHVSAGPLADLAAPGLLIGQAVGRIGDIINGEHPSTLTNLPWGTMYLHPDSPGSRFPVHPAVGYEMIWDLVVLGVVMVLGPRLPVKGMTYWMYLILYSLGRFLLSFLRLDPIRMGGLQISQVIALMAFYVGIFALVRLARRPAAA
ncbi:MAG: prolipoprotein diacylglyceryl transferase [Chloroflexi bacterium]|nr:prolipoprotein diacylglyceryl transferase [Chloroflexota bacterium]